jgi:beta-phosphoglucomutase-like phosphatase (HAD superfamily)
MNKKILFDCDGVLLDWAYAFDIWMSENGFKRIPKTDHIYEVEKRFAISKSEAIKQINKFNESNSVGFIPALNDAAQFIPKLYKAGYKLEVISCLHKDKHAQKLREKNLIHLFGEVFEDINCGLDFTKGKIEFLQKKYSGKKYFWLEDSVEHAIAGKNIGLKSVIMSHPYNSKWRGLRVSSMKEFYKLVTKTK